MALEPALAELVEALRHEQRARWQAGERVPAEAYLAQHPCLQGGSEYAVELVYHEVLLREALGEAPRREEYVGRFPQLASQLKPLFEVHRALESNTLAGWSLAGLARHPTLPSDNAGVPVDLPTVPGYEVLKELGRGGMGVVYWAFQLELHRPVALKMIRGGVDAAPQQLARFRAEAEAVARLQHPNIVQIYDVGLEGSLPYMALEYIEGSSLEQQLAGTPLPTRRAAQLLEVLARAVHYAHERGVVHRDLKPANVLLTPDGIPKLTDFGLAKLLVGGGIQTQSGTILGTPSYIAPEQATGKTKEIGPAADVYSLGAILYESITGRPPFLAETALQTILQVEAGDPLSPSRLQPNLPRDLVTICLKCLEKEPRKRYRSAEALAEDLRRFQAGEPILARPVGPVGRLGRWCRRNPALAMANGLAAFALLGIVALSIGFAIAASRDAERLRAAQVKTTAALEEAKRSLAQLARHQGWTLYEKGDVGAAMLLLAHSLEVAPAEEGDFQRAIRAELASWSRQLRPLRAVLEQPGRVYAVTFSPNGKMFATAGRNGIARLWETATATPIGEPLPHYALIGLVAFSPDSKLVLTSSHGNTGQLWDAATGKPLGSPLRHESPVGCMAFSPDGMTILTGSDDCTARLWKVPTGTPVGPPLKHDGPVVAVAFSPDGRTVLTGAHDRTARLWEAASGRPLEPPLSHRGKVQAAGFSPDGRLVVTGTRDGVGQVWDVTNKTPLGLPLKHGGCIRVAAFSPNGQLVLTVSEDHTARLWDATTGKPVTDPLRHQSMVGVGAFSPDGKIVLTGSADQTARLWDAATGSSLGAPLVGMREILVLAFSPDGRLILTGDENSARLWDATTKNPSVISLAERQPVGAVAFSPDGRYFLTGGRDILNGRGQAQLWETATCQRQGPVLRHPLPVASAAFSPDGLHFATGCGDPGTPTAKAEAQVWLTSSEKPAYTTPLQHDGSVFSLAFSPDGKLLLTGSWDKKARLWDVATGQCLRVLPRQPKAVLAVAFSPDGKTVLTGCADGSARFWETDTGKPLGEPLKHSGFVLGVVFSPDGKTVLTGCEDKVARLWRTDTREQIGQTPPHPGWVRVVAFSPDGRTIMTGSPGTGEGTAQLWDAATLKPLGARLPHAHWVLAGAFSPNGKTVLTGSGDFGLGGGEAQLWDVTPAPLEGSVERIVLWTQVITGMEVDSSGVPHVLDAPTWQQRSQHLKELGGPPTP
jgi:WD40 repeat protein/predicted Ser/Thr protein kinase